MSKVLIHPATYENVHLAVDRAFELSALLVKRKKVMILQNVLRRHTDADTISTKPVVRRHG